MTEAARVARGALVLAAVAALVGARILWLDRDPEVPLLHAEAGAEWLVADAPFQLRAQVAAATTASFRTRFRVQGSGGERALTLRAFRRCEVWLDGRRLPDDGERALTGWKVPRRIALPADLAAGTHELVLVAHNESAPAAVLVHGEAVDVRSGPGWEASADGETWAPARLASQPARPALQRRFPSVPRALASVAPWLGPLFAAVFAWALHAGRRPGARRGPTSRELRTLLLVLWCVLGANNFFAIPTEVGFDVSGHIEYIAAVALEHRLPLATEGWQMFQPPLYYLLSAPLLLVFAGLGPDGAVMAMRILPLACGLLLIEISWRCARLAFPDRDDLQALATLAAGLTPMGIYLCQVLGNEPLAACLTALTLLGCLALVTNLRRASPRWLMALGFVWGLALLAKATPLLLAPVLAGVVSWHLLSRGERPLRAAGSTLLVFLVAAATAGWYYARNWLVLGQPFVGGWDPVRGIRWWQDPGYRTWQQFGSFGESLLRPVYSGTASFWDALYSSLWLDGFLSGMVRFGRRPPWRDDFMLAGAWLALVPTALLFAGMLRALWGPPGPQRRALRLAAGCVVLYLAAIADLYLRLPIYSTAKASYALGLLPCYGLLFAAGAEPLLRVPVLRAFLVAWMTCWAAAAYLAYLV